MRQHTPQPIAVDIACSGKKRSLRSLNYFLNSMGHIPMHVSRRASTATLLVSALLVCSAVKSAGAAGVSTTLVPPTGQDAAMEVLVWSPCKSTPSEMRMGPYVVHASKDCAVAGRSLPLVVISHGQGGTRLGHHDTATALADAGFVVASFNHPGDSFGDDHSTNKIGIFGSRPAHVSRVISHMIDQWTGRGALDSHAVGVFGFSRGGYTALALAGAVPSATASASRFCGFWQSFVTPICRQLDGINNAFKAQPDPRVRAIVAADALNLFDASSFREVKVPVQLWASELGGAGVELAHTQQIRQWLPHAPEVSVAKGAGHFSFLAPCTEEFRKEARAICEDPRGFDRTQWHATMNKTVSGYFMKMLRSAAK